LEVGREQAAIDAADEARARLEVVRGELAEAARRREPLEVLARATGRDGVPLRVIDAVALPRVSEVANGVLEGLGGGFRVELRSTRATQRGELRDALDVVVHADGGEAAYEELSGGERTRVDLALRLGLASLLASRRGSEVSVLVVDEPEFLDAAGLERLAGALAGGVGGAYRRVLVVSHVAGLADAFDHTVRIVDGGQGATIA
jgi:DNA repair protein SbcC/Rad50